MNDILYEAILDELSVRVNNGLLTFEEASQISEVAYEKYYGDDYNSSDFVNNEDKYKAIAESLQEKIDNDEITYEEAEKINTRAYEKYILEEGSDDTPTSKKSGKGKIIAIALTAIAAATTTVAAIMRNQNLKKNPVLKKKLDELNMLIKESKELIKSINADKAIIKKEVESYNNLAKKLDYLVVKEVDVLNCNFNPTIYVFDSDHANYKDTIDIKGRLRKITLIYKKYEDEVNRLSSNLKEIKKLKLELNATAIKGNPKEEKLQKLDEKISKKREVVDSNKRDELKKSLRSFRSKDGDDDPVED